MARILLPKIAVDFEPVTWGSTGSVKDPERRKMFYDALVHAVRKKLVDFDFGALGRYLVANSVSIHLDFFIPDRDFRGLRYRKDVDNLCKIPIDAIYEHIVGDIDQDWHVVRIVAQKYPASEVRTELEIVAL